MDHFERKFRIVLQLNFKLSWAAARRKWTPFRSILLRSRAEPVKSASGTQLTERGPQITELSRETHRQASPDSQVSSCTSLSTRPCHILTPPPHSATPSYLTTTKRPSSSSLLRDSFFHTSTTTKSLFPHSLPTKSGPAPDPRRKTSL